VSRVKTMIPRLVRIPIVAMVLKRE